MNVEPERLRPLFRFGDAKDESRDWSRLEETRTASRLRKATAGMQQPASLEQILREISTGGVGPKAQATLEYAGTQWIEGDLQAIQQETRLTDREMATILEYAIGPLCRSKLHAEINRKANNETLQSWDVPMGRECSHWNAGVFGAWAKACRNLQREGEETTGHKTMETAIRVLQTYCDSWEATRPYPELEHHQHHDQEHDGTTVQTLEREATDAWARFRLADVGHSVFGDEAAKHRAIEIGLEQQWSWTRTEHESEDAWMRIAALVEALPNKERQQQKKRLDAALKEQLRRSVQCPGSIAAARVAKMLRKTEEELTAEDREMARKALQAAGTATGYDPWAQSARMELTFWISIETQRNKVWAEWILGEIDRWKHDGLEGWALQMVAEDTEQTLTEAGTRGPKKNAQGNEIRKAKYQLVKAREKGRNTATKGLRLVEIAKIDLSELQTSTLSALGEHKPLEGLAHIAYRVLPATDGPRQAPPSARDCVPTPIPTERMRVSVYDESANTSKADRHDAISNRQEGESIRYLMQIIVHGHIIPSLIEWRKHNKAQGVREALERVVQNSGHVETDHAPR